MKGARIGVGPRGPYVSAAKDGIYYRKHLGGAVHASTGQPGAFETSASVVLLAAGVIVLAAVAVTVWAVVTGCRRGRNGSAPKFFDPSPVKSPCHPPSRSANSFQATR